jgi:hypothetical protein
MDFIQALTLFGGAALIVATVTSIGAVITAFNSRRGDAARDELLRAGSRGEADSSDAGSRALGSTAWMRPDGGGF